MKKILSVLLVALLAASMVFAGGGKEKEALMTAKSHLTFIGGETRLEMTLHRRLLTFICLRTPIS